MSAQKRRHVVQFMMTDAAPFYFLSKKKKKKKKTPERNAEKGQDYVIYIRLNWRMTDVLGSGLRRRC